jgi:hypothetical protein
MNTSDKLNKLIRIAPIQTDREHRDSAGVKKVMQRHWQPDKFGRYFPATLTTEQIKPILTKARVKMENLHICNDSDSITYHYKGRPEIRLNLKDGQFYAHSSDIEAQGKEAVQQQAHMLLENLKQANLSGAVIGKPNFPPSARQVLDQLKTYKK